VAVSLPGKGETVYLTQGEARKLSAALLSAARDLKNKPSFVQSEFSTVEFELADPFKQKGAQ